MWVSALSQSQRGWSFELPADELSATRGEPPGAKLSRVPRSLLRFPRVVLFAVDIGMVF
jgi:hypothetical protein